MAKKKWSGNKHERIRQKKEFYKDDFAPMTLGELLENPHKLLNLKPGAEISDAFVMNIEVLFSGGHSCGHYWNERVADETREKQGRKPKKGVST